MSSLLQCIHCSKECKSSDSRPYPTSKSSDRIHNRCYIKKSLLDKKPKQTTSVVADASIEPKIKCFKSSTGILNSQDILEKLQQEQDELKKSSEAKILNKMIESKQDETEQTSTSKQFFFDMKAGVAKPHEKRKYLHHRTLCELAPRYDDHGHQEESIGRAYDHSGRDLNSPENSDEESNFKKRKPSSINLQVDDSSCPKRNARINNDYDSRPSKSSSRIKIDEQNQCWFCLSSSNVEKHLIISIGNHCYLTLAKGGLVKDHLLLLPIDHVQSIACQGNSDDLLLELDRFKNSLIRFFKALKMGVIFFERNFRSVHWQLQIVPIPLDSITSVSSKIKSKSKIHSKQLDYVNIPEQCTINDIIPPGKPYFFWQVEPVGEKFACQIDVKKSFFPVQLGRMVLADSELLDCKDRIDWKLCDMPKDEYVKVVESFKKRYEPFDITR